MQTRPRPADPDNPNDNPELTAPPETGPASLLPSGVLVRWLNFGLALVVVGLAFGYISKGWSGYNLLPGGRKTGLGLLGLMAVGLVVGRVSVGPGWARVATRLRTSVRFREAWPVGMIVLVAFGVRVWGVNFGLPYLEHVDEWNVAERGLHIVQTGNFDPHDYRHPGLADNDRQAFTYPTLYTYLQTGVYTVRFLQGINAGQYAGTSALADPLVTIDFYLWGRILTALVGAGTVLLVYIVGRRAYGRSVGLVSALFLSFFYLHALNSHWLTTDVPSGFMALLPFVVFWPILEGRDDRRLYVLAGFLGGLAIATKYNNALILLPLVLAHLLGRSPRRWTGWNLPLALLAVLAGFFAGAPFIFFHLPDFLTDLASIINHYQNTGHAGYEANDNWLEYLRFMLDENAAVVVLSLVGIVVMAARHTRRDLVLLAFPLLTYMQLSGYKVNFSRNLMPVIPFLALFGGLALVTLLDWVFEFSRSRLAGPATVSLNFDNTPSFENPAITAGGVAGRKKSLRLQNLAIGGLAWLAVLSPALAIVRYDAFNAQPTNRAQATAWIEANVAHGAKLWLEPLSTDLLPRSAYRLEGGTGVLAHPPEWFAVNGYHYLILSEAYYKEALQSGNAVVQASYKVLTEGPLPAGLTVAQDFRHNETDRPGARILILRTGLPLLTGAAEVSKLAQPLPFEFGGSVRLLGWQPPAPTAAGSTVLLNFYWQTLRPVGANYTTFIHLLNDSGQIVAQLDLAPFAGTRPTASWQPGEISHDDYPLSLPPGLAPGSYRLKLGLYQPANGARLALADGQTEAEVGRLEVVKAK